MYLINFATTPKVTFLKDMSGNLEEAKTVYMFPVFVDEVHFLDAGFPLPWSTYPSYM